MTQEQAVRLLYNEPYKVGKAIGFDKLTDIHNDWIKKMVKSNKDETLQAHRGSYKTTCVTLAIPILMLTQPKKTILFVRKTDTDVKEVVRQIKNVLKSDEMRYLVKCMWQKDLAFTLETQTELNTSLNESIKGTSQLTAFGIKGSITGKHYDYIFTDDIVNVDDRTSKAERDFTKLIYQELHNIKNRDGRFFNTGTPWHKEDCFSIMPEASKYDCYSTGLMTEEEVKVKRSEMAPSLFAANYELRHIASEDVIFENPQYTDNSNMVEQGTCHIDAGYHGEDFTAFTIVHKVDGIYYVFGKLWRKHVNEVLDQIIAFRKHYNAGKIYNESNADKGYLNERIQEKGERSELYSEFENKYIKIVTFLKKAWVNVRFVRETDQEYINQICDYNENAEHDDAPDSLSSLIRIIDNIGDTFSFD